MCFVLGQDIDTAHWKKTLYCIIYVHLTWSYSFFSLANFYSAFPEIFNNARDTKCHFPWKGILNGAGAIIRPVKRLLPSLRYQKGTKQCAITSNIFAFLMDIFPLTVRSLFSTFFQFIYLGLINCVCKGALLKQDAKIN